MNLNNYEEFVDYCICHVCKECDYSKYCNNDSKIKRLIVDEHRHKQIIINIRKAKLKKLLS